MTRIALLPGDGIGPEIVDSARRVLDAVGEFSYSEHRVGGASIDAHGTALTDEALATLEPPAGPVRWAAWTAAAHADYDANHDAPPIAPLDMAQVVKTVTSWKGSRRSATARASASEPPVTSSP